MRLENEKSIKFIKSFWANYEYKVVLAIGFLLVAVISFEFGYMQSKPINASPIIIEKAPVSPEISPEGLDNDIMKSDTNIAQKEATSTNSQQLTNCIYVGSKNSNKYYPPTCSYAKRIKPENLSCFKTESEATAQGRIRSTGCKY